MPGSADAFASFDAPSLQDGTIAFRGTVLTLPTAATERGIFTYNGGILDNNVGKDTAIPEGTGTSTDFTSYLALDAGNIAFDGYGVGQHGVYVTLGGLLRKVIDLTDTLGGKTFDLSSTGSFMDGKVTADPGSVIEADGSLVLGDVSSIDGYSSNGELRTNEFTLTLRDLDTAVLGPIRRLVAAVDLEC